MSNIQGTLVADAIVPLGSNATHYDAFGQAGWMSVANLVERDAIAVNPGVLDSDGISSGRRKYGMFVYVVTEDKVYQLKANEFAQLSNDDKAAVLADNANWIEAKLGGANFEYFNARPAHGMIGPVPMSVRTGHYYFKGGVLAQWNGPTTDLMFLDLNNTNWTLIAGGASEVVSVDLVRDSYIPGMPAGYTGLKPGDTVTAMDSRIIKNTFDDFGSYVRFTVVGSTFTIPFFGKSVSIALYEEPSGGFNVTKDNEAPVYIPYTAAAAFVSHTFTFDTTDFHTVTIETVNTAISTQAIVIAALQPGDSVEVQRATLELVTDNQVFTADMSELLNTPVAQDLSSNSTNAIPSVAAVNAAVVHRSGNETIGGNKVFTNNLGIGASPQATVDIFTPANTNAGQGLRITRPGPIYYSGVEFFTNGYGVDWAIGVNSAGLGFYQYGQAACTRLCMAPNGNVGINTTNPTANLHIVGPTPGSGANIQTNGDMLMPTGGMMAFGTYSYGGKYIGQNPTLGHDDLHIATNNYRTIFRSNGNVEFPAAIIGDGSQLTGVVSKTYVDTADANLQSKVTSNTTNIGSLTGLTTTVKNTIVAAINEVKTSLNGIFTSLDKLLGTSNYVTGGLSVAIAGEYGSVSGAHSVMLGGSDSYLNGSYSVLGASFNARNDANYVAAFGFNQQGTTIPSNTSPGVAAPAVTMSYFKRNFDGYSYYTSSSPNWGKISIGPTGNIQLDGASVQMRFRGAYIQRPYAAQDVVKYSGTTYVCTADHEPGASFDSTKWTTLV